MTRRSALRVLALPLVTLLLIGTLAAPMVLADDDDDGDDDFEEMARTVEVDEEPDRFEVRSRGPDGDEMRVRFRADAAELRLEFVPPNTDTVEVQLKLTAEALVEFGDADGNGRFDLGEGVVQEVEVDDLVFGTLDVQDANGARRIAVNYTDGDQDLSFGLVFHVVESPSEVNGVRVLPTEVKFDVLIGGFPFASDDTALALRLEMETEVEPRANFTGSEPELRAVGDRYAAFFRWNATVVVDDRLATVGSTVVEVETELEDGEFEVARTVALAYPRGAVIVHDPSVGVARAPFLPPPGDLPDVDQVLPGFSTLAYAAMLGVGLAFVAATLALRRRRG